MSCNICLNEMCSGGCCDVDYNTLQSIEYNLKVRLAEIGNNYSNRLKEGFSCSPTAFDFTINSIGRGESDEMGKLLLEFKHISNLLLVLRKELRNYYYDVTSCLKNKTLCTIKDKALTIIGVSCYNDCRLDIQVDSTNEGAWIEANPYCVSKEQWEANLYKVCNDLSVDITVVKKNCDIIYNIVREYQNCLLDYALTKTITNCELEYDLLRQDTDCTISYEIFKTLTECGITFDTVRSALRCGITFDIDRENNCPMIVTIRDTYSLCDDGYDGERLTNIIYTFATE